MLISLNFWSPFKCIGNPIWPCRKICQGQPRVIIYINFFKLEALLLHAKFHGHRTLGSEEEYVLKILAIYGHGCHLDHVTKTIVTKFKLPPPSKVQHKIWL